MGTIRIDKYTSIKAILMVDTEGKLLEISNGAINVLNLNLKSVKKKSNLVTDFVMQTMFLNIYNSTNLDSRLLG